MSSPWRDDLIPLLGPYNGEQLFPLTNVVLPAWLLLCFAPNWKYTHMIAWIPIFIHAILYLVSIIAILQQDSSGSFTSLEGIVQLFSDPNTVFIGWIHYVSFDLFVARAISLDAIQHTSSYLQYVILMGPCLFLCLMAGPVGLVLYAILKMIFFNKTKEKES